MKKLCGLACLIVSVLLVGSLVAPLHSSGESLPIVSVFEAGQGAEIFLNVGASGGSNNNCTNSALQPPTGYRCYPITGIPAFPTTIFFGNQRWKVGSTASNNRARVFVRDADDNVPDTMYVTGIAITPTTTTANPITVNTNTTLCNATGDSPCRRAHMTLKKTFDLGTGNAVGPLNWSSHAGGNFNAPDFSENVVQDRMIITGKACWSTLTCDVSTGFATRTGDTTPILSPIGGGSQGGININTPVTQVGTTNCSTSGGRCKQTVKLDYELTVRGFDTMNLTDSVSGCGGTCNPGFKKKGQLGPCGDENTAPDPNANPPEEPSLFYQCAQQLIADSNKDDESNVATGGVPAEVCGETCIVILLEGTPPESSGGAGPFIFSAAGEGLCNPSCEFDMTLLSNPAGEQVKVFKNLQPDPPAGDRTFIITGFPPGGAQGDFQLDQVHCRTNLGSTCQLINTGSGNNKTKIGFKVTNLVEGDGLVAELHVH